MRILYLTQYFVTRKGVGFTRAYEFARHFVKQGHHVTVLTAPRTSGAKGPRRYEEDGIEIVEVAGGYGDYVKGNSLSYRKRLAGFGGFALKSALAGVRLPRPDVVFATSPPLTIALPARAIARRFRVPLVFEVRDLWPRAPIEMGALTSPAAIRMARWLERTTYLSASHVVALSPGMRDGVIAAGTPPERVSLVTNASDLDLFHPDVDGSGVRKALGLERKFVCTYFGTMGEANDLMPLLGAAGILRARGEDDVVFLLHGAGKKRKDVERIVAERGLTNVRFSDPVPDKSAVARIVAASDVGMTLYKNLPVLYTCSPNKLFDTFAAGKPALVNTPGWQRALVEDHAAGVAVRPDDPEHFAQQVLFLRDNPKAREEYGRNARRLAESTFAREHLAAKLLGILERAASGKEASA